MNKRGFKHLLNIDRNAKTVKGQKQGFMTAILYLAPYKASGINVCPMAEIAGCHKACLNTAGRGGIASKRFRTPAGLLPDNNIQRARIARTRFFHEDRDGFMAKLQREIELFIGRAERRGLTPCVRLNGTSDILWEKIPVRSAYPVEAFGATIFDVFPDLQFYDYTKIAKRFEWPLPDNYQLTLSYSEASERYMYQVLNAQSEYNAPVVAVFRTRDDIERHMSRLRSAGLGKRLVDGDEHDLRFLDPEGAIIYLKAKGAARKDRTGFVIDTEKE